MSQRATQYVQSIAALLTESEACVALAIAALASEETDVAEATLAQIGALAGRKERCVRYCLRALEHHGFLVRDYQPYGWVIAKTFYHFAELEPVHRPRRPSDHHVLHIAEMARRRDEAIRARQPAPRRRPPAWNLGVRGCEEEPPREPRGKTARKARG